MSFLAGLMGNKAEGFVDMAVDKVADAAKEKVKEILGGDKEEEKEGGLGGIGGIFSSSKDDNKEEEKEGGLGGIEGIFSSSKDDNKEEEKGGFSGLFSADKDGQEKSTSGGDGGGFSLTDTLGDIAGDLAKGKEDSKDSPVESVLSMGEKLFL